MAGERGASSSTSNSVFLMIRPVPLCLLGGPPSSPITPNLKEPTMHVKRLTRSVRQMPSYLLSRGFIIICRLHRFPLGSSLQRMPSVSLQTHSHPTGHLTPCSPICTPRGAFCGGKPPAHSMRSIEAHAGFRWLHIRHRSDRESKTLHLLVFLIQASVAWKHSIFFCSIGCPD